MAERYILRLPVHSFNYLTYSYRAHSSPNHDHLVSVTRLFLVRNNCDILYRTVLDAAARFHFFFCSNEVDLPSTNLKVPTSLRHFELAATEGVVSSAQPGRPGTNQRNRVCEAAATAEARACAVRFSQNWRDSCCGSRYFKPRVGNSICDVTIRNEPVVIIFQSCSQRSLIIISYFAED